MCRICLQGQLTRALSLRGLHACHEDQHLDLTLRIWLCRSWQGQTTRLCC